MSITKKIKMFLHIPKTGGMSFKQYIFKNYPEYSYYHLINNKKQNIETSIKRFNTIPGDEVSKIEWCLGHYGFGIDKQLQNVKGEYFTILREPVDRIISHYYFVLSLEDHNWYDAGFQKGQSLEYLFDIKFHFSLFNLQTRFLASKNGNVITLKDKIHLDDNDLTIAKTNLDNYFKLIGITDRYDDFILLGQKLNYFPKSSCDLKNITKNRPQIKDIKKETTELIKYHNQLDTELYYYCKSKFEKLFKNIG